MESKVAKRIPYSQIRVMFDAAQKLEKQGKRIIHLEIGRPDFNTPEHIVEAAMDALRAGKHHYSQNAGIPELRQAISEKFSSEYNLEYDPQTEVMVSNGVAEGVYVAIHALLDPGDEILIPDPRWVNYDIDAFTNSVVPVDYTLHEDSGFQPFPEEIEEKITGSTKMILVASPSNPTGGVTKKNILEKIAELAIKHDLLVLSDEIYEKIVYPPAEHFSIATFPKMRERTILLNGFSKFYSMTGWRLGYVLGPSELVNPILRYHQYMITSTNTFAQWGAVTALKGDQGPSKAMVGEFHKRRDYMYEAINKIPGFQCPKPDGAFYLLPSIKETGMDGFKMAEMLLEKAGVATVAGECFGKKGAGHIRISYSNSLDNLREAVEKIESVMREI
ncbi:MAG: aminotransferase class I/II-fold pyridoxal phosphate-dependent enzyme [Candidatus Aminicenantes bacterium]|nr:aminotransferase class I/II-fold pyridoxal phosphate-dependent enzyme [Candidatus Aminicenantes bacterium]